MVVLWLTKSPLGPYPVCRAIRSIRRPLAGFCRRYPFWSSWDADSCRESMHVIRAARGSRRLHTVMNTRDPTGYYQRSDLGTIVTPLTELWRQNSTCCGRSQESDHIQPREALTNKNEASHTTEGQKVPANHLKNESIVDLQTVKERKDARCQSGRIIKRRKSGQDGGSQWEIMVETHVATM